MGAPHAQGTRTAGRAALGGGRWGCAFVLGIAAVVGVGCTQDSCPSPEPLSGPEGAGLARCANGSVVRAKPAACPASGSVDRCPLEDADGCTNGAQDCPGFGAPVCSTSQTLWGRASDCACYEACTSDDDCPEGTLCMCGYAGDEMSGYDGKSNRCIPAECRTDADCSGPGAHCVMVEVIGADPRFYCRDANAACQSDADCGYAEICTYDEATGAWGCAGMAHQ